MMEQNVAVRLKHFLDSRGLSSSRFADTCGIPRPSLSQLLNGRNRKISDVMVGQIHAAYPELSVVWLLFGEGPMLTAEAAAEPSEPSKGGENGPGRPSAGVADIFAKDLGLDLGFEVEEIAANKPVGVRATPAPSGAQIARETVAPRKVSHITVYYDDSTFETFFPK